MPFVSSTLAGLSIERLRTFCAVVEAGSIVAATGTDPNRQSQYSRQIKELEKTLGIPLFDRVGKSLKINADGRRLALAAQTFFGAMDDLIHAGEAKSESVRLGGGESVMRWLIMPQLSELMAGDPPLRFEIQTLPTAVTLKELETGAIDIGIIRSDAATLGLDKEALTSFRYELVVPRNLLKSKDGAEVFEGRPLPFAELAGDGFFATTARNLAVNLGINLQVVVQAQTFSLLVSAVESGTSAAFLPQVAARQLPEDRFARISVKGMEALDRHLCLVWKREVAESRAPVSRALTRIKRTIREKLVFSITHYSAKHSDPIADSHGSCGYMPQQESKCK